MKTFVIISMMADISWLVFVVLCIIAIVVLVMASLKNNRVEELLSENAQLKEENGNLRRKTSPTDEAILLAARADYAKERENATRTSDSGTFVYGKHA
ncbi:MAG: hypothetical protein IJX88_05275 [Clostridia bacterium]|nr:hypothetical protein [Clostridia bacterium]